MEAYGWDYSCDPSFSGAHRILGFSYLKRQQYEEAIDELQKVVEFPGRDSLNLGSLGYCYGVTGKRKEARRILQELEEMYAQLESPGRYLAKVYVGLGEKD
jgi:tetratricopeptide (TPR) repeat protein